MILENASYYVDNDTILHPKLLNCSLCIQRQLKPNCKCTYERHSNS